MQLLITNAICAIIIDAMMDLEHRLITLFKPDPEFIPDRSFQESFHRGTVFRREWNDFGHKPTHYTN